MSINLRELVTLILMMIYMRFPREQKSQHRLIFKDLNEAKMTKSSSSEASFNDNPKIFCSQLMILLCSCFDQNLSWSIQFCTRQSRHEENQRKGRRFSTFLFVYLAYESEIYFLKQASSFVK